MINPERIAANLETLRREVPSGVEIVAVSKYNPPEAIEAAYKAGQRIFGESRAQELLQKIPLLPQDIKWHFIGHLQTNKVKQLIGKTTLIESVDSLRLLNIIDEESRKQNVVARVLLQVHVAKEETKFGFSTDEIMEYFSSKGYNNLTSTHICGLMAMASNTTDIARVKSDFRKVADLFREIKEKEGTDLRGFEILSMGMSGDWPLAVEEGANLVRIGSSIFGDRMYK